MSGLKKKNSPNTTATIIWVTRFLPRLLSPFVNREDHDTDAES